MRYRQLDAQGDMVFGGDQSAFYVNQPAAPAQAALTRLRLALGEWFLDQSDGTNWKTGVLGKYTHASRDVIIKGRILRTQGVKSIVKYQSSFDGRTRKFSVIVLIDTIYGQISLEESL